VGKVKAYGLASIALLAPCYWQSRIQAGDLSSHIYNTWLARLVESGHAPGLAVATQTTNVLFDLMLSALYRAFGPDAAQRIAVSLAVLTFAWGALAFVAAVSGCRAWSLLPAIAALSYGWAFHMGFFNFYLGLGLCFWALALAWEEKPRRVALAAAVLLLAWTAHALPVAWTLSVAAYVWLARRLSPRRQFLLAAACFAAIVVARVVILRTMPHLWFQRQIGLAAGADQLWLFNNKYLLALTLLLLVWTLRGYDLIVRSGARQLFSGVLFQLSALTAAGVVLLPTALQIPGYRHSLAFISDRMSLATAILICALVGAARARALERVVTVVLVIVFFGFLYRDVRILNGLEDRMDAVVTQLAPGQRVIGGVDDLDLHVSVITHMIDRACVGHCFSYANYEPSTAQFRVRVAGDNPVVVADYMDSWRMQVGRYVVRERDLPLYQVTLDSDGQLVIRRLEAGTKCGTTQWKALPDLF